MTWDWQYVQQIMPSLMIGIWYTILVTIASSAIALVGGLLLAILESVSTTLGRTFVRFWLEFFRGVPVLVLLYFSFYVLPEIGVTMPALPIGIGVLGIVYAAFCSEVYRGSLITIPGELRDACVALNLSRFAMWQRVLIPLMVTRSIPALLNYVLSLFRLTAWLFAIGVPVLMFQADVVAEQSYRYLEPYTLTGLIYVAMNLPFLYVLYRFKVRHA
ncbi:amino acid ABC transporter permease [Bradyrhizobium sp. CCBAU 53421]|uniref:amino acid ABC transporter permease n=1 Tax=Bradyrhizobium sp. CCBAU 53421 TaxID=1325120 RepID=UPI00188B3B83|nr:ABC transporter permease subunit [Bradyrhizobium sp. CCBAU 53421]QOZ36526.1 ectoine/hydroxyectoine ABC transporter permease subunit EhuD [Bradyrhizobium sp. CCBAU 53421]